MCVVFGVRFGCYAPDRSSLNWPSESEHGVSSEWLPSTEGCYYGGKRREFPTKPLASRVMAQLSRSGSSAMYSGSFWRYPLGNIRHPSRVFMVPLETTVRTNDWPGCATPWIRRQSSTERCS
jgi:hypothetical protein